MIRFGLPVAALALVLDQATKWLAREGLWQPPRRIELTVFLNLAPVENRGISFGLLQSEGALGVWLISAFALAVSAGLGVWMSRLRRRWPALALGLVIGGALGNVIDRLRLGWVTDFIDFHVSAWHWPAFNMADTAIASGVAILLIDGLFGTAKQPK